MDTDPYLPLPLRARRGMIERIDRLVERMSAAGLDRSTITRMALAEGLTVLESQIERNAGPGPK